MSTGEAAPFPMRFGRSPYKRCGKTSFFRPHSQKAQFPRTSLDGVIKLPRVRTMRPEV
jgi:hypothetical protein